MRPPFTPGLYYLHMQDGTTIFAEIGTSSKCESWWIPIPKYAARDTPSDDWSEVIAYNQIHEPPLTPAATTPIHGPSDPTDGVHNATMGAIHGPLDPTDVIDSATMDAIHGPPDPTDGTDGDTGSLQTIARALMPARSACQPKSGDVGWNLDILWEQDDIRLVADLSRCDGWVHIMSQSRSGLDDEWWWTNGDDSIAIPRSAVDCLIKAVSSSAHRHK